MSAETKSPRKSIFSKVIVFILVGIIIIIFYFLIGFIFSLGSQSSRPGYGLSDKYQYVFDIQDELKSYLRIELPGGHGSGNGTGYTHTPRGCVEWVGSSNDSVKSMDNIHLILYVKLNGTRTYANQARLYGDYEWHYVVYTDTFTLPENIIDHSEEIIIPYIGIDEPRFLLELGIYIPVRYVQNN
jgi:hypothetical protein